MPACTTVLPLTRSNSRVLLQRTVLAFHEAAVSDRLWPKSPPRTGSRRQPCLARRPTVADHPATHRPPPAAASTL